MQVSDDRIQFSLPHVAAPFVRVQKVTSAEGQVDRNRPHYHPDTIEICVVVRGQLDWFVEEESFAIRPGEALVVPAEVVHGAVDSNLQPCELVTVHLAPERLPLNLVEAACTLTARRTRQTEISALVHRVFAAHRDGGRFLPEIVAALGALLVASIVELEEGDERKNSRLIRQAQRAMMGGSAVRPTVDEVAARLGVSSVWLHRLFVRETGASPGDWARAKRLSDAKRMLEGGRLSTVAIAMKLGYASGQSFATAFRRESGMTPSEYRALLATPDTAEARTVYRVDMRETWVDGVRIYPDTEGVRASEV